MPFFDNPTSPTSGQYAKEATAWAARIGASDGFIIVTPEYNHSYPAVLKNALDHIFWEWNRKPVAIVSYGARSGGARAREQLLPVVVELGMLPLRSSVAIPFPSSTVDAQDEAAARTHQAVLHMASNLVLWAEAAKRVQGTVDDPAPATRR